MKTRKSKLVANYSDTQLLVSLLDWELASVIYVNIYLGTVFLLSLMPFVLFPLMQLKILNVALWIALILLINTPICLIAFERVGINYNPLDSSILSRMLILGNLKFSNNVISSIIHCDIKFIESTNCLSGSIFD